jgi:hypothetical protein
MVSVGQILEEQKRQADKDKAASNGSAPVPRGNGSAVAIPDNRDIMDRYLDDVAPATAPGRGIKFSKGKFVFTDNDEAVPEGAIYKALCDQTLIAWLKFHGPGVPPDKIAGLLYQGFDLPPRDALGDNDPMQWETGLDGKPSDPWVHQISLVLESSESGELFTFITGSLTGRKAVGNLLRHFNQMERRREDAYPLVQLRTNSFQHKDPRVGKVLVPNLVVCGRVQKDGTARPAAVEAPFNDDVPF